jgi:hypothetical protein
VDSRLIAALRRLDDGELPVAELNRRLGSVAERLGLAQPSYQCVRLLVRDLRAGRGHPGVGELLLDIALRTRSPDRILAELSNRPPRTL